MKTCISIVFLILISNVNTSAQISKINWNVIDDSITLTPKRFKGKGVISIRTQSGNDLQVNGDIIIAPKEKQIFYSDGDNLFKLKTEDISLLEMADYKQLNRSSLANQIELYDTLLKEFRINLFNTLSLNDIEVLLTKNNEYVLGSNGLTIKRPKVLKGKICYLSLNKIILLSEEGELTSLVDGDFNYIQFDNMKAFECANVYNHYYRLYEQKLYETTSDWKNNIKKSNIESLIELFGPFDKVLIISLDKKLFTWNKPLMKYQFIISSSSISTSNSSVFTSNYYRYNNYISPLFYYGNIYRTAAYETTGTSIGLNNQVQSGDVVSRDESMVISITTDGQNNILNVYQDRLFTEPGYGLPYRFIKF